MTAGPRARRSACRGGFAVLLATLAATSATAAQPRRTRPADVVDGATVLELDGLWLFHTGDSPAFAQPGLDDIDWEAGELLVRGKGKRHDRLPMPADVGQALAEYLRRDRGCCASRRVFTYARAPRRGFAASFAISTIVRRAIDRAGVRTPTKGAHLLRHSLATDLLRRGASLDEIRELLRHRSADTTVLYAKVDLKSLREVAQPWPGGVE